MTQKTFDKQTATFISKLVASFPGDLTGDEMQKCIDDPKGIRDAIHAYLRPAVPKVLKSLLGEMALLTLVIDLTINVVENLKTRNAVENFEALWVEPSFSKILTLATGKAPTSITMRPRLLNEKASDNEIKAELPREYEIDPTAFVSMLATELSKVRAGKHSNMLNKNRRLLFYVGGFVVDVHWLRDGSVWSVRVWGDGNGIWHAGRFVFCYN